ncbi:MAG TPA: hypothetical protein VGB01_01630 [candidate division Zixibacteria bacterium]
MVNLKVYNPEGFLKVKKMVIWNSFKDGIKQVWENKILALILFLFKLFFALLLLIPAYYMFSRTFSLSPLSLNFLKGYDFSFLVDFLVEWRKTIGLYQVLFLILGAFSVFSYIFLSGGLWGAFFRDLKEGKQKFKGEKFFGDCAKYFWSFLKIFILISLIYILAFLLALLIFSLISTMAGKELTYNGHIVILVLDLLVLAIFFMWLAMWSDYLRIYRIYFEEKKLRRIIKPTLRFILKNFDKTVFLYYLVTIIFLGSLMAYFGLNKFLHFVFIEKFLILSLFILQQAYSLFRSFYRLVYYSSQMALFDKLYELK